MLRLLGALLLTGGSTGLGWSMRERLKERLEELYTIRQIFKMLQNEVIYSRASLPEACRLVGERVKHPYKEAFFEINREMYINSGEDFRTVWIKHMKQALAKVNMAETDKKIFLEFGSCIGFMDEKMQAKAMDQYMHRIDLSVGRQEKEIQNKCRVIMSLSMMGGILVAIILI